jgi:hypothetical protein
MLGSRASCKALHLTRLPSTSKPELELELYLYYTCFLLCSLALALPLTMDTVCCPSYPAGKLPLPPAPAPAGGIIDDYIFDPSFYSAIAANFSQLATDVNQTSGQNASAIWWGEGAFEFHSGKKATTNAFEDVLFSAVEVGSLAELGFGAWARSTLFGGFYELLDHRNGYAPNPSFWVGAILNRLVFAAAAAPPQPEQQQQEQEQRQEQQQAGGAGGGRINTFAVSSSLPTLQAFVFNPPAAAAAGAGVVGDSDGVGGGGGSGPTVALLVNLGSTAVEVKLAVLSSQSLLLSTASPGADDTEGSSLPPPPVPLVPPVDDTTQLQSTAAAPRLEWALTAPGGDMHSQHVLLNGARAPLAMSAKDGSVDKSVWAGVSREAAEPIVVPPRAVMIIKQD